MTNSDAELILYAAQASAYGLLLAASPDAERVRQKLYAAKREAADPQLDSLQIRLSPLEGGNLVIVRGTGK